MLYPLPPATLIAVSGYVELLRKFPSATRRKGQQYVHEGRVRDLRVGADLVSAVVRGTRGYTTELIKTGKGWRSACNCPAWSEHDPCKHVFAVVVAAMLEDHTERWGDPFADEDEPRTARGRAREVVEPDPSELLLAELERASLHSGGASTARSLTYVLSEGPPGAEYVRLLAVVPKRRGSGAPREFEILHAPPSRDTLDPVDRRALALLGGARDPLGPYVHTPSRPWKALPAELQSAILPDLAAHRRLHLGSETGVEADPLTPGQGGPWSFAISLSTVGPKLRLDASLRRGDERTELRDVRLALHGDLALVGPELRHVHWHAAHRLAEALLGRCPIEFPASAREPLLQVLGRCSKTLSIDAPGLVEDIDASPTAVLAVPAPDGSKAEIACRIEFDYCGRRLGHGAADVLVQDGKLSRVRRDVERELALEREYVAAGGRLYERPRKGVSGTLALDGFTKAIRDLDARGWIVEADRKRLRTGGTSRVSVHSGIDWFDLEASVEFAGATAHVPALLEALTNQTRMVRLSDGSLGLLPEGWLESWGLLLRAGEVRKDAVRFTKSRAFLLDALLAEREAVEVDPPFARMRERLARARAPQGVEQPKDFRGELRPYQREGLGWLGFLGETGLGGCLADDMGLGKTVQMLAFALTRRAKARGPTLVVAPRSLVFNWEREGERFAPSLSLLVHHGLKRARTSARLEDADLVLTTYGTLRQDIELLSKIEFDLAVLDEAQAIKNPQSQSAKAARLLRADLRIALTGTPVENRIGDLLSIFEFLNPGLLEGSRALRRILEEGDEMEAARFASRALGSFLLRRTKEEVLADLPPRTEQTLMCELEGAQKREYSSLREHYRRTLLAKVDELGMDKTRMNVLEALLRLRQAACHLALLDQGRSEVASAKLETLLPLLEEVLAAGHKALVFSQFTRFLALVREELDAREIAYEYLDGRTRDREAKVKNFQEDPAVGVFLISLKAGGLGLNLTSADYVFLLDPWWNPAVERQAVDRAHRIGQVRPVTAYRIVARDTVEEKVLALQEHKRALAEALFAGEGRALRQLSREDLEWVLS